MGLETKKQKAREYYLKNKSKIIKQTRRYYKVHKKEIAEKRKQCSNKKDTCEKCGVSCCGKLCKKCWTIYYFPEHKKKLIKLNTGRRAWSKGLTKEDHPSLAILSRKVSKKLKGKRKGKENPNWKGDKVKYRGLHSWIERNKIKPFVCEECKTNPPKHLANISGKYRRDINDFEWLCRSCHSKKDGLAFNLPNVRNHKI